VRVRVRGGKENFGVATTKAKSRLQ